MHHVRVPAQRAITPPRPPPPLAATFGAALPPLVFAIARELHMSAWGAALAATFVILDGLNTIESRLILVDSSLLLLSATALCVRACGGAVFVCGAC